MSSTLCEKNQPKQIATEPAKVMASHGFDDARAARAQSANIKLGGLPAKSKF